MSFIRTSSGISNQHLFHGVDLVVFVEGGEKNFTNEEVNNNFYSDHSIDVAFWSKLFYEFKPDKEIKFKAVGSKSTVLKVAEEIANNNIVTVYVAMDKEFDEVNGKMIKHKNILYTFGYSWENDAWNVDLIKSILDKLCHEPYNKTKVDSIYQSFLTRMKFCVAADGYYFSKSESFLPRNGHLRILECDSKKETFVKKQELDKLINTLKYKKSTISSFARRNDIETKANCYGHLFGDFCRHIVHHILTIMKFGKVSSEIVRSLVIVDFIEHLPGNLREYYQTRLT